MSEARGENAMQPHRRTLLWAGLGILILISMVGFVLFKSHAQQQTQDLRAVTNQNHVQGDWEEGRQLLNHYGCATCHQIDGIGQGRTYVGPPLDKWSQRRYIAGNLPNTPENLIAWIVDPQAIEPGTAMPNLGVTEEEARHISAYLYSLGY